MTTVIQTSKLANISCMSRGSVYVGPVSVDEGV